MPAWNIAPVTAQPHATLTDWAVFEVTLPRYARLRTRHLAGWSLEDQQGQVCSKLVSFDAAAGTFVTQSGRVYRLAGRSGLSANAQYVLNAWLRLSEASGFVDVTREMEELLGAKGLQACL